MNKNLLIIGAAIGAYALLRPKAGSLVASNTQTNGAAAYTPPTYVPTYAPTPAPAATNWLSTAAGAASTAAGIVKAGTSIWADISGAFGSNVKPAASATASATASDYAGGNDIWAGPNYQTS